MKLDVQSLCIKLSAAKSEECVSSEDVNPYLLKEVLAPLLSGESLCYSDIDYDMFEADDLRVLSYYCDELDRLSFRLQSLVGHIADARPYAASTRAFC